MEISMGINRILVYSEDVFLEIVKKFFDIDIGFPIVALIFTFVSLALI